MQELYTAAFDLQPLCAPYVGYQLLGEDARRGRFLLKLQEIYRQNGLFQKPEMADHLSPVLHFLATAPDSEERSALIAEGLRPALEKMADAFPDGENPYGRLIEALRACLETAPPAQAVYAPKEVAHA
jgi:nitrate reductase delta subunit